MRPADFSALMVATPCYGGLVTEAYLRSVFDLCQEMQRRRVPWQLLTSPGDSLISRARNTVAATFLASTCSHLLFIDADIGFKPIDVARLLAADKDLIAGVYPLKGIDAGFPMKFLPGSERSINCDPDSGAVEVLDAPTGFMMIKRRVFDAMMRAHPEWRYRGQPWLTDEERALCHAFFDTGIAEDGELLSEDYLFCRRWRELGGSVWILPDIELKHYGMHGFTGSVMSRLVTGPAQVAHPVEQGMEAA